MNIKDNRKRVGKIWNLIQEIETKLPSTGQISIPLLGGWVLKEWKDGNITTKTELHSQLADRQEIAKILEQEKIVKRIQCPSIPVDPIDTPVYFVLEVNLKHFSTLYSEWKRTHELWSEFYRLSQSKPEGVLICRDFIYDTRNQEIRSRANEPERLLTASPSGKLFICLLKSPNTIFSYEEISAQFGEGYEGTVARDEAKQLLKEIKKKLKAAGLSNEDHDNLFITRKGFGIKHN